jgi:hypothetical protein
VDENMEKSNNAGESKKSSGWEIVNSGKKSREKQATNLVIPEVF